MLKDYKKAKINGRVTTVVTPIEALKNEAYQNKFTSVEINGMILPVKKSYDPTSPGFYIMDPGSNIGKFIYPNNEDKAEYSSENAVDFSDVETMKDLINKQEELKRMESEVLSNSDNLFKPVIKENDSPEMKAMKKAICLKNIDLDLYQDRFGDNFNNDKRLLKGSSITISKMKAICDRLDIKATLTLSDISESIPNPMRESITVDICGYNEEN